MSDTENGAETADRLAEARAELQREYHERLEACQREVAESLRRHGFSLDIRQQIVFVPREG